MSNSFPAFSKHTPSFIKVMHPYDEKENSTNKLKRKSNRPLYTTSIPSPNAEANMLFVLVNVRPSRTDKLRSHVNELINSDVIY